MSYLAQPASKIEHGVVRIGNFINVDRDGVINIPEIIQGPGISVDYNTDFITISAQGADLINVYGTTVNYTLTEKDEYVGVDSATAVTITLPDMPDEGKVYIIKDERGQGAGKISIQPSSGTLIDNKVNYVFNIPNQCIHLLYRADDWWII
jgi:hypothetical protein